MVFPGLLGKARLHSEMKGTIMVDLTVRFYDRGQEVMSSRCALIKHTVRSVTFVIVSLHGPALARMISRAPADDTESALYKLWEMVEFHAHHTRMEEVFARIRAF